MKNLKHQYINMLVDKTIDAVLDTDDAENMIAHLMIHGKYYNLAERSLDDLHDMTWDEYSDEFLDSEEGKSNNDDVPERTRFENWLMKQDVPNWYGRG